MKSHHDNPNVRKGRFLWMESDAQRRYVTDLKSRIHNRTFFTEQILQKIVDEIAPVFDDQVREEVSI